MSSGEIRHENVKVPEPCEEQYTPQLDQLTMLLGAGVTTTSLFAVTPSKLIVISLLFQLELFKVI